MLKMLGKTGCKVVEVVNSDVVVVEDEHENRIQIPDEFVEKDYSNIWALYSHKPIFIMVQTVIVVVLWLLFSATHGEAGVPWAQSMGGLESIWPGQTSLLFNHDCEDY